MQASPRSANAHAALGWIDPTLVDNLVTDLDRARPTYRLVVASALVGLAGRLADVVVMELVDDPHGRDPCSTRCSVLDPRISWR